MVKSKIKNKTDGYLALYKDLKFDINSNCVTISNAQEQMVLQDESDYIIGFQFITQFAITEEDIKLIQIRYGLVTGVAFTLTECGEQLSVSAECVRSRIQQSFRKIKHYTNINRSIKRWNRMGSKSRFEGGNIGDYTGTKTI